MTKDARKIFLKIFFLILYFLVAMMALSLEKDHGEASIVWTPMGLGLSILYVYGLNFWPFLFLGMLSAGIFVKLTLFTAFVLALIDTGIILLAVNFLRKIDFDSSLESIRDAIEFIITALLGSFLEITITMAILSYQGIETWLISWLGEFVGIITVAPMFLTWNRTSFKGTNSNYRFLETFLLIILTGLISYLVFNNSRGMYLLFPCLIWVVFRHGTFGANCIVFLIAAVFTTKLGLQGFQKGNLIKIQLAMGLISLTSMILAAVIAEFFKVKNDLRRLNESLELRVAERTEELLNEIAAKKAIEKVLSESEAKYRELFETSQDGVILLDENGRIVEWNHGLEKITGFSKADVLGWTYWEVCSRLAPNNGSTLVATDILKEYLPGLLRVNQDRLPEIRIKRLDGSERVIQLLTFVIKSNESTMVGGIIRDVTKQILIKQSVISYAERLKILYETDHDILKAESLEELSEIMLASFRRLYKCRRVSILNYNWNNVGAVLLNVDFDGETRWGPGAWLSPENYQVPQEFVTGEAFLVDDLSKRPELPKVYQDMVKEGLKSYLSLPLIAQGELIGSINLGSESTGYFTREIVKVIRQVANHYAIAIYQARLHEQLGESREQLRQLAQRLVSVQEGERRRLSRELHDDAGQELTALKIMLELIFQDLPPEHPQLRSWLEESIDLTNMAMETIRSLAQGLRPPALDAVGLSPALEELCNDFSRRTGLRLTYNGDRLPFLAEPLNICLYRVLQEALTNIAKHAKAREIEVQLIKDGETIYLSIMDDGVGFSQSSEDYLNRKGIGLIGMQERLEALEGSLQIQTENGEGTRIIATIPWKGDYR